MRADDCLLRGCLGSAGRAKPSHKVDHLQCAVRGLSDKALRFDVPTVRLKRGAQVCARLGQRLRPSGARSEGYLLFHLCVGQGTAKCLPDFGWGGLSLGGLRLGVGDGVCLGFLAAGREALEKQKGYGAQGSVESLQGEAGPGGGGGF